ncbi:MAG: amidohydrolase, partial [Gammaproteobacteria bacterium]|nr:amidohydrolase [Gammaproteobacteria bacterium]
TTQQNRRALIVALTRLASLGLTGVHDAGIDLNTAKLYRELDDEKQLPIRVYAMLAEEVYADFGAPLVDNGSGYLAIQSVKAYLDGALGSRGAAMIRPYIDEPDNAGLLFKTERQFRKLVRATSRKGFQLNVHAIGDKANRVALNGFSIKGVNSDLRHRIEHAQVIRPDDIPRFAELGIIASMQPTHATSDKNMAEDRIGAGRMSGAYAWRRLLDSGAVLAAGSDFPVEPAEPLFGIHAAVTRQDRDNQPPDGWYPQQALTRGEALRVFTLDAAYAARQEKHLGSLEPGKRADFVLLAEDIFTIPASEIWSVKVRETWVNGTCIYRATD